MQLPTLKDYLQLHFVVLIWGFTAILGELISIPSVELVFWRTLIAAAGVFMLIKLCQRHIPYTEPQELLKMLLTGGLIAAHWILFFAAARISTVSICLVGMATCSLWTSLLEPIFHKRKVRPLEIFIGLVIIAGLYQVFASEFSYALGLVLAILSAMLGALFSIMNSKLVRKHAPLHITLYEMVGAFGSTVLFLPFYYFYLAEGQSLRLAASPSDWLYIGILALVCTVYAYAKGVQLMRKFTPFAVNLTVNLEPVYGIVLAYFIFGEKEKMSADFYLGASIILLAVLSYPVLDKWLKNRHKNQDTESRLAASSSNH